MRQLFDNLLFQTFADRATMTMTRGGAEYGECVTTAARITLGDVDSWYRKWVATAERVESWGEESAHRGHPVSARKAYLRASSYYRLSFYPLFGAPVDPRLVAAFDRESRCFGRFAALMEPPLAPVEVTFEGTSLPGYLCLLDASRSRPTHDRGGERLRLVHEMYWSHAVPALRQGYNCLLVDGPGQGRVLIKQGLHMRPNWETVMRPIVDFACTRPEIDRKRIAVMRWSFGGFLAPRGVSGDQRIAALIADPGQWDQLESIRAGLPCRRNSWTGFPTSMRRNWILTLPASPLTRCFAGGSSSEDCGCMS